MTLAARDLTVSYPTSGTIIDNLSVSFEAGSLVCVQAPSGRGKTTLLAALGGLLTPDRGTIWFGDKPASRPELRHATTWILQSQNVLPHRTAVDNVALAIAAEQTDWRRATLTAVDVLDRLGLGHRRNAFAATLSGGERQRVCVARAVLTSVPVILADEPTANLDRAATATVMDALRMASDEGRIVIVASHDPDVSALSDATISRW